MSWGRGRHIINGHHVAAVGYPAPCISLLCPGSGQLFQSLIFGGSLIPPQDGS